MLHNYLKTAWRSLRKNKTFSVLNIIGLSIGVACSLLIALYVLDELSYDRFNTRAERIYRINEQVRFGDFNYDGAETPPIMGPVFARDFKAIEHYTRFKTEPGLVIRKGNESFTEDRAVYTDSTLFDVFSLDMIAGDKKTALKEPHSLVITESLAKKYFSSLDIIGKTLTLYDTSNYTITGVIKDIPRQSHFNFDLFLPMSEKERSRRDTWITYDFQTYLVLRPGTDVKTFEKQLNAAFERYQAPQVNSQLHLTDEAFQKAGSYIRCSLIPLTDIHLYSHVQDELGINGNIRYVYIFSAIAIFILLLACINFMNLSTASSANRAKEVGVRKVLGGQKNSLIAQFLTESFVACLLSFVIAIGMAALLLPLFNDLAGKDIHASLLLQPSILSGIAALLIVVSLISGSYPAFYLASFRPIRVLKGTLSTGFKGSALRNMLVVIQFTVSVALMVGTGVIHKQLEYIRSKDLGFTREQVLIINNTSTLNNNTKAFTNELLQMPGVKNVTSTGFLPVKGNRTIQGFITEPHFDGKNFTMMESWPVDDRYLPTFQMQLVNGRNFSPLRPTDSTGVIINEAAAKMYGGKDPVDRPLYMLTDLTGTLATYHVIGVIKDFNFSSLHDQVKPLVLNLQHNNESMAVRVSANNLPGLLSQIRSRWKSMTTAQPLSYYFLDEEFNKQYSAYQRLGSLFLVFSILAIVIACLGLFGLVTFAAQQRVKEIGIRKVLGAAVSNIFVLLSKDLVKLLLLSIAIACPIAWWAMNKWLQDFAYRISIDWWMFAVVGGICLLIAIVTISFQAIKAAIANPVKSLRAE